MKYASDDSNIATVDSTGLIRGISPGITTITCKSEKDTYEKTQVQVIVRAFTDTVKTFSTKVGNTLQLSPTISDSDTSKITYSNLTSDIIDVSANGLVTAKMMGTGRVLAREENSGAQTEYTINVVDSTPPVISVSPTSSSYAKNTNITIKVTDNSGELNSNNSYQYQLGTSKTTAPTGTWTNYTNGTAFTIGTNLTGTYYLWVRQVSDKEDNISQQGGTKVETYHVFGEYKFDNSKPKVTFGTNGKTYTIVTGNTQTISSTVTVSDTGGAGVNTTKYAWSTSNSTTPTSWTAFTNGGTISKSSVAIGSTYYLWIQATDTVGNTVTTKSSAFTVLEARWQNTTSGTYYNTLSLAVSGSTTGTTIKLLKSYTDTSSVSISKNLTIDINSYTLTKTTSNISINSGYTVTVSGSGTVEGQLSSQLFKNSGTLNFTSSNTLEITNTNSYAVYNAGTLNINNYCNISSSNSTIYQASGTLNKNGAYSVVSSSGGYTLYVTGGTVNLNAGTITASGSSQTIFNSAGTVNVQGAEVSKTTASSNAIYNSGILNIKSGTVTSDQKRAAVTNYATLTMSGGNVINTCSSGGCIALASSQSSTISGGRIYVTKSRSATDTSGQTYNLYQHNGGTMNITGGTIGNEAYNSTTVLGNYGLVIQGGTVNMTGGRINIASNTTYPGRGVLILGGTSVFNLSGESYESGAYITALSEVYGASTYNIGVELRDSTSTFNISGYAQIYARLKDGGTSGYSIYKMAGIYSESGSPIIYGSTYGI